MPSSLPGNLDRIQNDYLRIAVDLLIAESEPDFFAALADAANYLQQNAPVATTGHGLCEILWRLAEIVGGETLQRNLETLLRDQLIREGFTRVVAVAVAHAVSKVVVKMGTDALGVTKWKVTLLLLIPMICPDYDRCPIAGDAATELLKELLPVLPTGI